MSQTFVISDAFWKEFQNQKVFKDIWAMIQATPSPVRNVHIRMMQAGQYPPDPSENHSFYPDVGPRTTMDTPSGFNTPSDSENFTWQRDTRWQGTIASYMDEHYPMLVHGADVFKPRWATTLAELTSQAPRDITQRATGCSVKLKRVSANPRRWTYAVNCGGGTRAVKIKAIPLASSKSFADCDVYVACSCPFWVYYGCEYHAKTQGYLDGRLQGNGSAPNDRDPKKKNLLCKHVVAALSAVRRASFVREDELYER